MRPVSLPDITLKLPPLLCGGVGVYALVHACGASAIDAGMRFDKRLKETHRFTIADTRGRLDLTVPVAKPESSSCSWSEVRVSTHGAWWDVHRVALESAYGRTPFFEFYIDRFLPMLSVGVEERYPFITDLSAAWDSEVRRILCLPQPVAVAEATDGGKKCVVIPPRGPLPEVKPYYQVRQASLGFMPGLSVLDLIFNLGPEATLYLDRLAREATEIVKTTANESEAVKEAES